MIIKQNSMICMDKLIFMDSMMSNKIMKIIEIKVIMIIEGNQKIRSTSK